MWCEKQIQKDKGKEKKILMRRQIWNTHSPDHAFMPAYLWTRPGEGWKCKDPFPFCPCEGLNHNFCLCAQTGSDKPHPQHYTDQGNGVRVGPFCKQPEEGECMRKGIAGLVLVCALPAPLEEFWHSISMIQALLCSPSAFFENADCYLPANVQTLWGKKALFSIIGFPIGWKKYLQIGFPLKVDVSRTAGLT